MEKSNHIPSWHYHYQNVPMDGPGFYTYIREKNEPVWSPTGQPCNVLIDDWKAEHHPGWSKFVGTKNNLKVELKLFCAMDIDAICYDLTLENKSTVEKEIDVFAYADLAQLEWMTDLFYGYYIQSQVTTFYEKNFC